MRDAYVHLCDALDHIKKKENAPDGILVYKDHNGDDVITGTSLRLCEVLFSVLSDMRRTGIFRTPRSIYYWLSCYHYLDYVENSYENGIGWYIEKPIVTSKFRKYIIRRKVLHNGPA
jgi:hypothetical protein